MAEDRRLLGQYAALQGKLELEVALLMRRKAGLSLSIVSKQVLVVAQY